MIGTLTSGILNSGTNLNYQGINFQHTQLDTIMESLKEFDIEQSLGQVVSIMFWFALNKLLVLTIQNWLQISVPLDHSIAVFQIPFITFISYLKEVVLN